jgi:Cu(I)/Ag(I) efflux system membrane protein CusA/SilA
MAGAALLSITLVPVLMGYLVRGTIRSQNANPVNRWLMRAYRPIIARVLAHPWRIVAGAAVVLAATVFPWSRLGSEFMPPLDEGSLLFMPTTVPGVSIAQARQIMRYQDSVLASFPEVASVFGKVGRANTATDPAPLDMYETTVVLKPRDQWRPRMTTERLVSEMDRAVRLPGVTNAWTMPIKNRIDMLATGIRTPVGVKIYGPNLDTLQQLGERVERILQDVRGTRNVFAERNVSGYYVDVRTDRAQAARFGLNAGDLHDVVMATAGGITAAITVEGRERYEVNVRYPRELRDNVQKLREIVVPTMSGVQIPLGQVAEVSVVQGPMAVKTDDAFPVTTVYVDIEGRDLGGYVRDAQQVVAAQLTLPPGYRLTWSGQFEFMARVRQKLQLVVPVTLGIIFLLLYLNFRGVAESLIVMLTLPFAMVGGVWSIWALGYNTSVAVWVGFIALAGVAAETGVVMLIYLDEAFERHTETGSQTREALAQAVLEGAVQRLRPVMMTVTAIIAGLAPILWGGGTGADVMKRIAAPMVGGMVTATLLTLAVIPAIYFLWRNWEVGRRAARKHVSTGGAV